MLGSADTEEAYLARLKRVLPYSVPVAGRRRPEFRSALVRIVGEELLPFITYGPQYRRQVTDYVRQAVRMFSLERGEEYLHWIGEAVNTGMRFRQVGPLERDARTVDATSWGVARYTDPAQGALLHVYAYDKDDPQAVTGMAVRHPVHYGKRFGSGREAEEYAWNAGLLRRYVGQ